MIKKLAFILMCIFLNIFMISCNASVAQNESSTPTNYSGDTVCANGNTKCEFIDATFTLFSCVDNNWTLSSESCEGKVCSEDNTTCVECVVSHNCKTEEKPFCENNVCVECFSGTETCEITPEGTSQMKICVNNAWTYTPCDNGMICNTVGTACEATN